MKNNKRCLLVCVILLLSSLMASAQVKRTITGIVNDDKGNPVAKATVTVKGTSQAVTTDENGRYSITIEKDNAVLVFSSAEFSPQEITIGTATSVDAVLTASASGELEGVVVTALGIKRSPRSLGYAAQKVSGADLDIAQAPTVGQGLAGKVAGLQISQSGGGVEGGSSRIVIRGNTSLTGDNRALIIVDGVPINNDPMNNGTGATGLGNNSDVSSVSDWGTGLNMINPDDIENITVLKGPAAAALYGARGGNGVILITRKKGEKRKGLGVDYSFATRTTDVYQYMDLQDKYGSGLVGSLWTADQAKQFPVNGAGQRYQIGTYTGTYAAGDYKTGAFGMLPYNNSVQAWDLFSFPSGLSWGPRFDNQPILWYDGVTRPYSAQPDNWKAFFRDGYTTQHNVSISGGGDFGTARFSYTRDKNQANILNSDYTTNTFNIGSTLKVSSKVSAEITGSYVNFTRLNIPPIGSGGYLAGIMYAMTRDYRSDVELMNNFKPDGSQRDVNNSSNFPGTNPAYPYYGGYLANQFWNIYKNNTTFNRNQWLGSAKITANITDWLTLIGSGAIDNSNDGTETRNYPKNIEGTQGYYGETLARTNNRTLTGMARLYKDNLFGKNINASLTGGVESYYRNDYSVSAHTNGDFVKPFVFALNNGRDNPSAPDELRYAKKINSGFGFLDVSFKNYLFLQVTGRNDWSSTLDDRYNSYFYPSASLAYVFSDGVAGLKTSAPWLSFGKLSVSYAETGSDTDPYSIFNTLNVNPFNGQAAQTYPGLLKYAGIEPQRSRAVDVILNLGLFNNRLNLELTGYTMKTQNQILFNPLPMSSGYTQLQLNKGAISNKGFEFVINATPIANKNFTWAVSINGSRARSKVLSLDEGIDDLQIANFFGGNGVSQRVRVGSSYGTIYGRDFTYLNGKRVVDTARGAGGQPLTYTVNGKTYLGGTKWVLTSSEVPIGDQTPDLVGGIANTFRYKNFSLYVLTDAKIGGDTYFGSYAAAMGNGLLNETTKERDGGGLPYVYPDGTTDNTGIIFDGVFANGTPNTNVVAAPWYYLSTYTSWNHVGVPRSASVFRNSWMKLRELALTYRVPDQFVQKTKFIRGLNVSLIGRDLFYIFTTIPKGLNPEGVNGIGNAQGIEYSSMPRIRSYGVSVKASF